MAQREGGNRAHIGRPGAPVIPEVPGGRGSALAPDGAAGFGAGRRPKIRRPRATTARNALIGAAMPNAAAQDGRRSNRGCPAEKRKRRDRL